MRIRATLIVVTSLVGCYNSGPGGSSSGPGGTTSSSTGGTTGFASTGTSTTGGPGTTGGSSSSSGTPTFPLPIVTITSPDAGGCAGLDQGWPSLGITATGFEWSMGGPCSGSGPCGVALAEVTGPSGSCNEAMNFAPPNNVAAGVPPLMLNLQGCPTVNGPMGPRIPPGLYTVSVFLEAMGAPPNLNYTLLSLPDGGPLATSTFIGSYHDGFTCEASPEVVLERPIDRRIDGLTISRGWVYAAENGGGDGDIIGVPEGSPLFGVDAGAVLLVRPGTQGQQFWPSAISTDGTSAFVTENNTPYNVIAVPLDGGLVVLLTPDAGETGPASANLVSTATGTYWMGPEGLWHVPSGTTAARVLNPTLSSNALAVDSTGVYFADSFAMPAPAMVWAPLDGGAPEILVTNLNAPVGIAVDASRVYWAEAYPGETSDIRAAPKADGDGGAATLLMDLTGPQEILMDGSGPSETIYFSSGNGITRVLPDAGQQTISPQWLQRTGTSLGYMAIDGAYLYWATDFEIVRVHL